MADNRPGNRDRSNSIFSDDDSSNERWRGNEQASPRSNQSYGAQQGADDRGFFSKAGDEVRSWFGDNEAEQRREDDARRWERDHGEAGRYQGSGPAVDSRDRGYADTGGRARDYERSQFRGGYDRNDLGDWRRADAQGGNHDERNAPAYDRSHQSGGDRSGQDRYGPPSGYGWSGSGQGDSGQSGRYGQVGQASYGQTPGANRNEFGHFGSERDYGHAGQAQGRGQDAQGNRFGGSPHDESYRRWRDQQMEQLDREYDDYCRHRQSQFERDFHGFRQNRAVQQSGQNQVTAGAASSAGTTAGQQAAGTTADTTASAATGSSGTTASAAKDAGSAKSA